MDFTSTETTASYVPLAVRSAPRFRAVPTAPMGSISSRLLASSAQPTARSARLTQAALNAQTDTTSTTSNVFLAHPTVSCARQLRLAQTVPMATIWPPPTVCPARQTAESATQVLSARLASLGTTSQVHINARNALTTVLCAKTHSSA